MIWDTLHWNPMKHKYTITILNRNNEQINKQTNNSIWHNSKILNLRMWNRIYSKQKKQTKKKTNKNI